jgi:hypothetical protein
MFLRPVSSGATISAPDYNRNPDRMSVAMTSPWLWGLKSTRAPLCVGSLNQSAGPAAIRRKGQSSGASTLVPDFPPETIVPADDVLNSKK